jgi:hypothetical protein
LPAPTRTTPSSRPAVGVSDVAEVGMNASSIFWKEQLLIVLGAVKNVDHFDGLGVNPIEDQVVAIGAAADAEVLVARD